ncbi:hypothetical protein ANT2_4392 [plant metagenome]|uniref:Uncharacterized protein n=1 Tax=plant metagenome TaxID=1297885 RepID=A0A484THX4_9ZZZZ
MTTPREGAFHALWRAHGPDVPEVLLDAVARGAFDRLAASSDTPPAAAFALECGLTPGLRAHLYLALRGETELAAAGLPGGLSHAYLRYTRNDAGDASVPLPLVPPGVHAADTPRVAKALHALGVPPDTVARAQACLAAFPPDATLDNIGWLDRRPGQPMRCYVSHLPLGCPPHQRLGDTAQALASLADRCVATFDIDAQGPRPRWGLELLVSRGNPDPAARWRLMLDALRERGLATEAAAQAALAWPARLDGHANGGPAKRGISHLCLTLQAGQVRDARVFLLAARQAT